jgi:hypothetical protein
MNELGQLHVDFAIVATLMGAIACGGDLRSDAGDATQTGIMVAGTEGGGTASTTASSTAEGSTDDTTESPSSDSAEATDETGEGQKFDTLAIPDSALSCQGLGDEFSFSFLWAANSGEGTISKIDTKTVTEVGRYIVRPDSNGSPSRTSVSLSGHVVVANRSGGVTKIYADEQFCQESNGQPGIQTSKDYDALPWGLEECVAWYKPMAYASQRPVAWGLGQFDASNCQWTDEELWTSGTNQGLSLDIHVLDGDDGTTKETIVVPFGGNGLSNDFNGTYYGIYGGAVDGNGDFWGTQLGTEARLIRVKRDDMTWQIWQPPVSSWWYGMTVDSEGMVWMCSHAVARFDPNTETWATAQVGGSAGCMADAQEVERVVRDQHRLRGLRVGGRVWQQRQQGRSGDRAGLDIWRARGRVHVLGHDRLRAEQRRNAERLASNTPAKGFALSHLSGIASASRPPTSLALTRVGWFPVGVPRLSH